MDANVFTISELPAEELIAGVFQRSALRLDGALVTFNHFQPGFHRQKPHSHPFDQLALIVSGTFAMTVGDQEIVLTAGQAVHIPADVLHTGHPVGDEPVFNIDVFAPAREDYLYFTANQADWGPVPTVPPGSPFAGGAA